MDCDFALLTNAIAVKDEECTHADAKGSSVCNQCGMHMIVTSNSWGTQHARYSRKGDQEKSLFEDVRGLGLPDDVTLYANNIYQQITFEKIFRGNTRRGIICTCVFYAYNNLYPEKFCYGDVITMFKVENKVALKGLKLINSQIPHIAIVTSPVTYIRNYMLKIRASDKQIASVIQLFHRMENHTFIDRPRPQSIAAAFIYFWIKNTPTISLTLTSLSHETRVSRLTIERLEKDIRSKLNTSEDEQK
jgi:transcription initiation factor TFIIIB Brf1 subunit/transcription initiation factor TFIIB